MSDPTREGVAASGRGSSVIQVTVADDAAGRIADRLQAADLHVEAACIRVLLRDRRDAQAKLDRLREDYDLLARWAGEQNAGNAFAEQVAMYAQARVAEWDEPVERWEP